MTDLNVDEKYLVRITSSRPAWMNRNRQFSWGRARTTIVADFRAAHEGARRIEQQMSEKAIEFGYCARQAFHLLGEWGHPVESQLEPEWSKFETDARYGWDRMSVAVKHGYERARKIAGHFVTSR